MKKFFKKIGKGMKKVGKAIGKPFKKLMKTKLGKIIGTIGMMMIGGWMMAGAKSFVGSMWAGQGMSTAFSVCRTGNIWRLKMQDTQTEGTFGTLGAAMRCAYLLADGIQDWKTNSDGGTA